MKVNNLITDKQAAEILGVKPAYLAHMRCTSRKTRLSYEKRDWHVFYRLEDVEKFRDMLNEKKKHSRKKAKV